MLVGGPGSVRSSPAWLQVYRALEHGVAKNACANATKIALFPKEIQDFANTFVSMQKKRHDADYNPYAVFLKSSVLVDIKAAAKAIEDFKVVSIKDRRAFATYVIFRER